MGVGSCRFFVVHSSSFSSFSYGRVMPARAMAPLWGGPRCPPVGRLGAFPRCPAVPSVPAPPPRQLLSRSVQSILPILASHIPLFVTWSLLDSNRHSAGYPARGIYLHTRYLITIRVEVVAWRRERFCARWSLVSVSRSRLLCGTDRGWQGGMCKRWRKWLTS